MIRSLLHQLRRRLALQAFCSAFARALLGAAGMLLLGMAFAPPFSWLGLGLLGGVAIAMAAGAAALWTWRRRPSLEEAAALMDAAAGTHDRLATALAFESETGMAESSSGKTTASLRRAAVEECERYLSLGGGFDFRRWTPWKMPPQAPWLFAPVLAIVLLQLWVKAPAAREELARASRPGDPGALRVAAQLETMAQRLEKQEKGRADLQKMAEALKKSASRLRAEAAEAAPDKAALRELSAMEELARSVQQEKALKTLGDALSKADAAKKAAEALKKGDADAAAAQLESLGKRIAEDKEAQEQIKKLQEALKEASRRLGEKSPLGEAAQRAATAAQQGDKPGMDQAMAQMSRAMREAGKDGGSRSSSSGNGEGQSSRELQQMIAALREIKSNGKEGAGQPQAKSPDMGKEGKAGSGKIGMLDPSQNGQGKEKGDSARGMATTPGGQPGSEKDEGSKASPFAKDKKNTVQADQAGLQTQLQGILGEGESLRSLIPAGPGQEPAKSGYKNLYEAAAPAAEDALERENIPLGSRVFIKRYFEAIRPAQ